MIKHTLEISQRPARVSLRHQQIILHLDEDERSFAAEDVGVLILQHPAISISAAALNALQEAGAAVIICGNNHLPTGLLLPVVQHTELVPRLMAQLEADKPARKRAWKAIVQAKVRAQADNIPEPYKNKLLNLAKNVKSGDPENIEAQAAKIYWPARFPERYKAGDKRDANSESIFNSALNYGYAIIRASVARALVSAGLQPALGVFHHSRGNPYCLADDVMEPLRPLVDNAVHQILSEEPPTDRKLTKNHRHILLSLLTHEVEVGGLKGPLMATLPRYIASFYRLLVKESDKLDPPHY